jgi:hypothetical protein
MEMQKMLEHPLAEMDANQPQVKADRNAGRNKGR